MFKRLIMLLIAAVVFGSTAVPSLAKTGPHGVELVQTSECRIDFNRSVKWVGDHNQKNFMSERLALQISWLVAQLPKKCQQHACVFVNIDLFYFQRIKPRFLEGLKSKYRDALVAAFNRCWIEVIQPAPLSSGGGGGCDGGGGNSADVSVEAGSQNVSVSATQVGCNDLTIVINGSNIWVTIAQIGQNSAHLVFNVNDFNFNGYQNGNHNYNGNFTSGQNATVIQQ